MSHAHRWRLPVRRPISGLLASVLWASLAAAGWIAASAAPALAEPAADFADQFDRFDPAVWTTVGRGPAEARDGALRLAGCFACTRDKSYRDCEIAFRARAPEGASEVQVWAGFRCRDRDERYALGLRGGNCDDLYLCRYSPGGKNRMLALEPLGFHPRCGQWFRLRAVMQGGRIEVYLDDEKEPRILVVDSQPLGPGGVVLGGGWIETEFDDVRVVRLKEAADRGEEGFHSRARKVNFQEGTEPLVPGWAAADGSAYDKGRGYGWEAALKDGTRRRNRSQDLLKDSLAVVAHGQEKATFVYDVPDGRFVLTVCGGDPDFATHFEACAQDEADPFVNDEVQAGATVSATRVVEVKGGQFRVTFRSNHPRGQAGSSICYLVLESAADVPDKAAAAEKAAAVQKETAQRKTALQAQKAKLRAAQRQAYRPATVESLPGPRCEIGLDGNWLFKPEYEVRPDDKPFSPDASDDDWHIMPVPQFWNPTVNWLYLEPDNGLPHAGTGVSDNFRQQEEARCRAYTFDSARTDAAWYRHWVTLPGDVAGRHVVLSFDAVSKLADVWLNGVRVGGHVGMFGPFELDVTSAVRPGRNLIAARVAIRRGPASPTGGQVVGVAVTMKIREDMLNDMPRGIYGHQGGIWQPVRLTVTSPVRIDDVFARVRSDGTAVDVTLGNHARAARRLGVEMAVRPLRGKLSQSPFSGAARRGEERPVYRSPGPTAVELGAGGTANVTLDTGRIDVRPWSPESPNLYLLEVSIVDAGRVLDRTTTTIGFRSFETRGNRFYLNGRPYWLRGASHTPMGLAPNDARLADVFLKLMHDGNQMATRDVCAPMSQTWLDAADRQGVAVSHEGPWPWMMGGAIPSRELLDIWRDEQAALVKAHRNHPSLFLYTMNNEMFFTHPHGGDQKLRLEKWKELSTTIQTVRRLDLTRPVVASSSYVRERNDWERNLKPAGIDDGDVDDRHAYYGWYEGTHFSLFDGLWTRPGYGTTGANPDRPYISQECSTGYPNNDTGHPTRRYLYFNYTPQSFVGDWAYEDHDPAVFLARQALITKEVAEAIRRTSPGAAGVLHFANICWFRNVYDARRIEPYPAYFAARRALEPVLVSAELFGRNCFAGSELEARVCVVNDRPDGKPLPAMRLDWEIRRGAPTPPQRPTEGLPPDSWIGSKGNAAVEPVEHYGRRWTSVKFDMPKELPSPRADCELLLTLWHGEAKLSENEYAITLARREWAAAGRSPSPGPIALYDPGRQFGPLLETLGLKTAAVVDLAKAGSAESGLLIVAGVDALAEPPPGWAGLRQYVEKGGSLLLIHPGKHVQALLPDCVRSVLDQPGEMVNMRVPESRVFDGLGPLDLSWWNVQPGTTPLACRRSFRLERIERVHALATYLQVHWYLSNPQKQVDELGGSPLFEAAVGKGRLLVCEMMVEAAPRDPIAARLLVNAIACLAGPL